MNTQNQITETNFVYRTDKGTPVTDSLKVAQAFGRLHKNVLKSIRTLCAINIAQSQKHFAQTTYTDARGRRLPRFLMTQEGFSQIVLRFKGERANAMKDKFAEMFAKMTEVVANVAQQQQQQQTAMQVIPQTYGDALLLAGQLQKEKEANEPMLNYAQTITASSTSESVGEFSKTLLQGGMNIGEKRLFELLRNDGYLCKYGEERNLPTQRSLQMGLFEVKRVPFIKANGKHDVHKQPRITPKGQVYFINRFLYNNSQQTTA